MAWGDARSTAVGALALAAAVVAACGGGSGTASGSQQLAARFTPPPPLGPVVASDASAPAADYLGRVHELLRPGWRGFLEDCRLRLPPSHPLNQASLSVELALVLDAAGQIVELEVADRSGSGDFDRAAIEVVRDAAPLASPGPAELSDDGRAHLRWRFSRDVRQAGAGTARWVHVVWPIRRLVPGLLADGRIGRAAARIAGASEEDLRSGDVAVERQRELFGALDRVAVAAIRRGLRSGDQVARAAAVRAARRLSLGSTTDELAAIADGAGDVATRAEAIRGFAELSDARGLAFARGHAMAEGAASEIVSAGISAMVARGDADEVQRLALDGLKSADAGVRWRALLFASLVAVPAAHEALQARFADRSGGGRLERMAAAQALGAIAGRGGREGAAALSTLIGGLDEPDAAIRETCARGLARAAGTGAASRIGYWKVVGLLRDPDERVRAAAVLAAAALEPARFASELSRLARESSELVLEAEAEVLATITDRRATTRLVALLSRAEQAVRRAAAVSLLARPDGAEWVARLREHADASVRVLALGRSDDREDLRARLFAEVWSERVAALARLVELDRWGVLPDAARMLAEAGAASALQVEVAAAWLGSARRAQPGQ